MDEHSIRLTVALERDDLARRESIPFDEIAGNADLAAMPESVLRTSKHSELLTRLIICPACLITIAAGILLFITASDKANNTSCVCFGFGAVFILGGLLALCALLAPEIRSLKRLLRLRLTNGVETTEYAFDAAGMTIRGAGGEKSLRYCELDAALELADGLLLAAGDDYFWLPVRFISRADGEQIIARLRTTDADGGLRYISCTQAEFPETVRIRRATANDD